MTMYKSAFFIPNPPGGNCTLCPHRCKLRPGGYGRCGVRYCAEDGWLYAIAYGRPTALQIDPIEKKPLARFMPGSRTFSIGTPGCNLACAWCQNAELSTASYPTLEPAAGEEFYAPARLVELAVAHHCRSVAFTYNEPTVWAEYAGDIADAAHAAGLAAVLVSNAYINPEAAAVFFPKIDAANFDLKGMSEMFYRGHCGGSLAPVLLAIEQFYRLGKHLELTNLVIPGLNDRPEDIEKLLDFVEAKLDRNVPLHFSAFFPRHRAADLPATPAATLYRIRGQAENRGFRYVYLGNL